MRDLSLHLLDLIENSTRAGASVIAISIAQDQAQDSMTLSIEDNGPGLPTSPEQASDPFYTTKPNKRVGLGISLFAATAERAGGHMEIAGSPLGGVAIRAVMRLGHIDRTPLGDIPSTLAAAVCANPDVDFRVAISRNGRTFCVSSAETASRLAAEGRPPFLAAQEVSTSLRNAISRAGLAE